MKKVLIITYYWPPSGGGGVQRWLKFTKYLPEFGWEPIILTPSNPSVIEQDESLCADVNLELKVIKTPIWEPYHLTTKLFKTQTVPKQGIVNTKSNFFGSILIWLRGNLLIPDTRIFWKSKAIKIAKKIIMEETIDIVVTTGPPHSMHLIGKSLRNKLTIKWIADFRDPWADWDLLDQLKLTDMARKRHEKLECMIFDLADGVLTVSESWAKDFSMKYRKSIKVITNGFDSCNFIKKKSSSQSKFRISHFGLINQFRNVPEIWQVLGKLCQNESSFADDLEIFLAGNVEKSVFESIQENNLNDKTKYSNYIPHEQLNNEYEKTSVFLLLSNKTRNAKGHIPGKLFEYLYFQKPILAFSDPAGDVTRIINRTNSGISIDSDNTDLIKETIFNLYHSFKNGDQSPPNEDISMFERRNLTKNLAEYFDNQLIV